MFITATNSMIPPKWIVNFPTKTHWRYLSSYAYIESGLDDLILQIHNLHICSIALPPLGAGQGGLEWEKVRQIIINKMSQLDIDVLAYEPTKQHFLVAETEVIGLTKVRAMILYLMRQYNRLGFDLTILEVQKLAYFLQRMGKTDLNLHFVKYHYGPYAQNLQHLLHELEKGYILTEKAILDSKPLDIIYLNPAREKDVEFYIKKNVLRRKRIA